MKHLYMIGGTMGAGKTAVCQYLKEKLSDAVFLDGDWCWDASPFQVTDETKKMVEENICFLLNNFLHCSAYENIIFCWVMHEQHIIDRLMEQIDTENCQVHVISLTVDEKTLKSRIMGDVEREIRTEDVLERSVARLPLYQRLDTEKTDTTGKTIPMIVEEILAMNKEYHIL